MKKIILMFLFVSVFSFTGLSNLFVNDGHALNIGSSETTSDNFQNLVEEDQPAEEPAEEPADEPEEEPEGDEPPAEPTEG